MTDASKATIYLSQERGLEENESFRSYRTFNFAEFFNEYKIPFGDLYALNDDSLAGGYSTDTLVSENTRVILLPVVGAVSYKDGLGNTSLVNAGALQVIDLPADTHFELSNPYQTELVNYIQFWIRTPIVKMSPNPLLLTFDLTLQKNHLIELADLSTSSEHFLKLSIGQFRGREEASYTPKDNNSGLFIFIVEGAFEVQGRLLHPRDGLALWNMQGAVELEALSNEAIVVVVEILHRKPAA